MHASTVHVQHMLHMWGGDAYAECRCYWSCKHTHTVSVSQGEDEATHVRVFTTSVLLRQEHPKPTTALTTCSCGNVPPATKGLYDSEWVVVPTINLSPEEAIVAPRSCPSFCSTEVFTIST